MIKVGIIGGTGYTGVELLRILSQHQQAEIKVITSRSQAGNNVGSLFPNLDINLKFSPPQSSLLKDCDVVFCAAPNGVAMTFAMDLINADVRLIDLAADFRFSDLDLWSNWYQLDHACPSLTEKAVYGLVEANRNKIKTAKIVGNPGCYPTAVSLALLPFLEAKVIKQNNIIADCKSGISGAGRVASVSSLQAESSENFKAYAVSGHRHQPEIEHNLTKIVSSKVELSFVPHLVPMIRGIQATIYTELKDPNFNPWMILSEYYQDEYFVGISKASPETRWVKGSNHCKISLQQNGKQLIIFSVIDNLVKGASGQAVQNMNVMFGLQETTGLTQTALLP